MFAQESVMDIQKEKKAIKNLKAFFMEDWNLTEEERDDLDNLVSRIVAVVKTEAQAVPEWISVNDNLPPANMLVLGMSQTRSNIFNVYNVMALDEFEEAEVTHWMPLPDAPQEPTDD